MRACGAPQPFYTPCSPADQVQGTLCGTGLARGGIPRLQIVRSCGLRGWCSIALVQGGSIVKRLASDQPGRRRTLARVGALRVAQGRYPMRRRLASVRRWRAPHGARGGPRQLGAQSDQTSDQSCVGFEVLRAPSHGVAADWGADRSARLGIAGGGFRWRAEYVLIARGGRFWRPVKLR